MTKSLMSATSQAQAPVVFDPPVGECLKCGDRVKSSYEGEFVWCKCGSAAIDSTRHYTRGIGELKLIPRD